MKTLLLGCIGILLAGVSCVVQSSDRDKAEDLVLFPSGEAENINPDTHLQLTFPGVPKLGSAGEIRIYDAADDVPVDILDLSIPPGPDKPTPSPSAVYTPVLYEYVSGRFTNANTRAGTPSGLALPTSDDYQRTIIGGFTDAFHFYPVIIHENTATIYPHNNILEFGRTYYVEIDPGVLTMEGGEFEGISGKNGWRFTTKHSPPPLARDRLTVSADGSGDFNTVQGAIDFIPDYYPERITILVRKGRYEEIVYFRNKTNITVVGEDRDKTVVFYKNSEVFNPHPVNIKTNEVPGTFPSRRAAFAADHCKGIHLVNLTVQNTAYGQAEGLLINGEEMIVSNTTIIGSGDALQSNGSAYYSDCHIVGDGDTILGRGPAFFKNCELNSLGPYMWIRNTSANHGNVFIRCLFKTRGDRTTVLARSPTNGGKNYPFSEAVLIDCALSGIDPAGWGEIGGDVSNIRYWEYNSTDVNTGRPVDVSRRHRASRQLGMQNDSEMIASYKDPAFVLGGWTPQMPPFILTQPEPANVKPGQTVTFHVKVAAIPDPACQWFRNGSPVEGATTPTLTIKNAGRADAGRYTVMTTNRAGNATSKEVLLNLIQ